MTFVNRMCEGITVLTVYVHVYVNGADHSGSLKNKFFLLYQSSKKKLLVIENNEKHLEQRQTCQWLNTRVPWNNERTQNTWCKNLVFTPIFVFFPSVLHVQEKKPTKSKTFPDVLSKWWVLFTDRFEKRMLQPYMKLKAENSHRHTRVDTHLYVCALQQVIDEFRKGLLGSGSPVWVRPHRHIQAWAPSACTHKSHTHTPPHTHALISTCDTVPFMLFTI